MNIVQVISCTLVTAILLSTLILPPVAGYTRAPYTGAVKVRLYIGGYIYNKGSTPVPVNETDLLIFYYPLNLSDQRVLDYTAYINGIVVPRNYTRLIVDDKRILLVINESFLEDPIIDPGENISVGVEYIVEIDMDKRRKVLGSFLGIYPGDWDAVIVADESLVKETKLWNFTNPLVGLLAEYILNNKEYNKTPYNYVLGLLAWFRENIVYSTRLPPRQPWEVIAFRKGDCDDQANLFIALLRAAGIPSYSELGIVFVSRDFEYSGIASDGYFKYKFIGGGGHGWVVAYIPPWSYLRIDLTFAGRTTRLRDYIIRAAYYNYPTVVLEHIIGDEDYTVQTLKTLSELREKKLEEYILIVVEVIED